MKKYTLVSGFLDRERDLIITPEYIAYENNDAVGHTFTKLLQPDVIALKYRLDQIVWYKFHVGKKFVFMLKDKHGKTLEVVVKNFFGMRKNFASQCENIVADLQNYFLTPIVDHHLNIFFNSSPVTLGSTTLDASGLRTPTLSLSWRETAVQEYYSYFVVYKIGNPEVHHRVGFDEWDAEVVLSVIRAILKEKHNPES
ncbi:MAG TPA: hypothetical protein VIU12_01065 [Chryseolinea sp.]